MSKNLIRKGLAISAAVALGITGISAIPANASDPTSTTAITNLTYTGTGTTMVAGATFTIGSQVLGNYGGFVDGSYMTGTGNTRTITGSTKTFSATQDAGEVDVTDAWKWVSTNSKIVVSDAKDGASAVVSVGAAGITAVETTSVFPYIDLDGIVGLSVGDLMGPSVSVTFVPYVEAEWVNTVTAVYTSASSANLTLAVTPAATITGLNKAQLSSQLDFAVYKNGLSVSDVTAVTLLAGSLSPATSGVYTTRAFIAAGPTWLGALSASTTVAYQFAEKLVADVEFDAQASANVTNGSVAGGPNLVRKGTSSLTVTATVEDAYGNPVKRAGIPVRFSVYGISATSSVLTFNGTTLSSLSTLPAYISTVTNASGVATLTVTNSAGAVNDSFSVDAQVIDSSAAYADATDQTYTWVAAAATNVFETRNVGANTNVINSVKGQSYTLEWTVTDNFGQPYSGSDLRINYAASGGPTISGYVAVVNGKATLTVTEAALVEGAYTITGTVAVQTPNTNTFVPGSIYAATIVNVVGNNTPSKLDVKPLTSVPVNYDEFANNNFSLVTQYNTLFTGISSLDDSVVIVEGTVVNQNGVLLPGARVELRGNGIFFDDSTTSGVYAQNSIVVYADADGVYKAYFASHKSGKQTITATSGSASASESLTVLAPSYDWAYDIKVTGAPKSVSAGNRVLSVSFAVVDEWGNTVSHTADVTRGIMGVVPTRPYVDFSVSSDKGLILAQKPAAGDLAVYTARVLLQARDLGPTTVSMSWTANTEDLEMVPVNGYVSPFGSYNLTGSATVWSGPAVNATAGAKKGRVVVEAYRAVGRTVSVFVGSTKVASFVPDKANDKFVVKGIKKGNRKVSVTISGIGYDYKWQRDGRISVK